MKSTQPRLSHEISHWQKEHNQAMIDWYWSTPAGKVRLNRRVKSFKEAIQKIQGKILEIGCGTGMLTKELIPTANDMIAIDISPHLIGLAKLRVQSDKINFLVTNAHQTDFEDNQFGCILGLSVLHHLNIEQAISEFYRLLKPGGKVVFSEPNMLNPQVFLERNIPFIRRWMKNTPDETAFYKWKIRQKFHKKGFTDIQIKPFDFLHPASPLPLLPAIEKTAMVCERVPFLKEIAGSLWITATKT